MWRGRCAPGRAGGLHGADVSMSGLSGRQPHPVCPIRGDGGVPAMRRRARPPSRVDRGRATARLSLVRDHGSLHPEGLSPGARAVHRDRRIRDQHRLLVSSRCRSSTYLVLLASALLDMVLYYRVPDVTICYRCLSQVRGPGSNPESRFRPFDLAVGERYRQERIRIEELRKRGGPVGVRPSRTVAARRSETRDGIDSDPSRSGQRSPLPRLAFEVHLLPWMSVAPGFIDDLRGVVAGELYFEPLDRAPYAHDASLYEIDPLGVIVPRTEDDVVTVVRYAAENRIPLHARGAGTDTGGGALGPGLVIDFSRHLRKVAQDHRGPRGGRAGRGPRRPQRRACPAGPSARAGPGQRQDRHGRRHDQRRRGRAPGRCGSARSATRSSSSAWSSPRARSPTSGSSRGPPTTTSRPTSRTWSFGSSRTSIARARSGWPS